MFTSPNKSKYFQPTQKRFAAILPLIFGLLVIAAPLIAFEWDIHLFIPPQPFPFSSQMRMAAIMLTSVIALTMIGKTRGAARN